MRKNQQLKRLTFARATWAQARDKLEASSAPRAAVELLIEDQDGKVETSLRSQPRIELFGARYALQPHKQLPALTQCSHCQTLGHLAKACQGRWVRCGICAGQHHTSKHRQECALCRSEGVTDPACPHPPLCVNCGGPHRSDDRVCSSMRKYALPRSRTSSPAPAPQPGPSRTRAPSPPPAAPRSPPPTGDLDDPMGNVQAPGE